MASRSQVGVGKLGTRWPKANAATTSSNASSTGLTHHDELSISLAM